MKKLVIVPCSKCGTPVGRIHDGRIAVCFDCKQNRNRQATKLRRRAMREALRTVPTEARGLFALECAEG